MTTPVMRGMTPRQRDKARAQRRRQQQERDRRALEHSAAKTPEQEAEVARLRAELNINLT